MPSVSFNVFCVMAVYEDYFLSVCINESLCAMERLKAVMSALADGWGEERLF